MKRLVVVAGMVMALASASWADPILLVDIGPTGSTGEDGWDNYTFTALSPGNVTTGPVTAFGPYTVQMKGISSSAYVFNVAAPAGPTLGDVYRDGYYGDPGYRNDLIILGLTNGTQYDVTFWHWNPNDPSGQNRSYGLWNGNVSVNFTYLLVPAGGTPDDDADFRSTYTFIASQGGIVILGAGAINGFVLDDNPDGAMDPLPAGEIPEPATLLLVGTGALGVFGYALRRRMK